MKTKYILPLIALVLLTAVPFIASAEPSIASADNSCAECHSNQVDPWLKPFYEEWDRSPHNEEGVTCDLCHGGNPEESDKDVAHRGILSPGDPDSKVHYKNIIPMCGEGSNCHTSISEAYTESKHYENIMEGKLAPDCRTCMGSHDVTLNTDHIILGCQKCMNSENSVSEEILLKGRSTHAMMETTDHEIEEVEKLLKLSGKQGLNLTIAQTELETAKVGMVDHDVEFHKFDTDAQLENFAKSYNSALAARQIIEAAMKDRSNIQLYIGIGFVLIVATPLAFGGILLVARRLMKKRIPVEVE